MAENMLEITDENFSSEVLESDVPVLVDFWATWCGPCLMLAPVMEELADDYAGRVVVGKVNAESEYPRVGIHFFGHCQINSFRKLHLKCHANTPWNNSSSPG